MKLPLIIVYLIILQIAELWGAFYIPQYIIGDDSLIHYWWCFPYAITVMVVIIVTFIILACAIKEWGDRWLKLGKE